MNKLSNECFAVILEFLNKTEVQSFAQCSKEMKATVDHILGHKIRMNLPQITHHIRRNKWYLNTSKLHLFRDDHQPAINAPNHWYYYHRSSKDF